MNRKVCTLGYSTQSLTRILCSTSALVNINLSMPIGPTTRTTDPYCLTHCRWGIPASPLIIFRNWPDIGLPRDGPGIERSGESKYGYKIKRWTTKYVMKTCSSHPGNIRWLLSREVTRRYTPPVAKTTSRMRWSVTARLTWSEVDLKVLVRHVGDIIKHNSWMRLTIQVVHYICSVNCGAQLSQMSVHHLW